MSLLFLMPILSAAAYSFVNICRACRLTVYPYLYKLFSLYGELTASHYHCFNKLTVRKGADAAGPMN